MSGGELFTAVNADYPRERIHFHGNNKSYSELNYAFDEKIGCIVIDNFTEIALVKEISGDSQGKNGCTHTCNAGC